MIMAFVGVVLSCFIGIGLERSFRELEYFWKQVRLIFYI